MGRFRDEPRLPTLLRVIIKILLGWFISLIRFLIALIRKWLKQRRKKREHKWPVPCHTYPSDLWRRPDVYIYSQSWLRAQDMAVTWDNPDIELKYAGTIVDSYHLEPNKEYDLIAKVHNRSVSSPAFGVRVVFSFRSFGIGGGLSQIGETTVDVSVSGGASNPASALVKWTSPSTPGHYCIIAEIMPPDDLNWADNKGQENTNVVGVTPGDPSFVIPIFNDTEEAREVVLEVDSYQLPEKPLPPGLPRAKLKSNARRKALKTQDWLFGHRDPNFVAKQISAVRNWRLKRCLDVIKANAAGNYPCPTEWNVTLDKQITVPPGESLDVPFAFRVPDDAEIGLKQVFNISGFDNKIGLLGGVTFIAEVQAVNRKEQK